MKGTRVNRRLILIAFVLAVLLGAGGQAVALWSQSSNVTMQVSVRNMPAPSFTNCVAVNGQKINLYWQSAQGTAAGYTVVVTRNGAVVPGVYTGGESLEIQFRSRGVQAGDTWAVSVTGNYSSGWATETARYQFRTVANGNQADLACA